MKFFDREYVKKMIEAILGFYGCAAGVCLCVMLFLMMFAVNSGKVWKIFEIILSCSLVSILFVAAAYVIGWVIYAIIMGIEYLFMK